MRRTVFAALSIIALAVSGAAVLQFTSPAPAAALGNGLALTPPMGFNDWNAFGCDVSESLIKQTAQTMRQRRHAGRRLPVRQHRRLLDAASRDSHGHLVPDPAKFPDGISGAADYVHSLGLKLGIYEDAGTTTCAGLPGQPRPRDADAQHFAAWGVDYLKYDNCNSRPARTSRRRRRYTAMRDALARDRPADRLQHLRVGPGQRVDLGAGDRQHLAHHGRHQRQLAACCPSSTATWARHLRRPRRAGTTRTCWRSATAA